MELLELIIEEFWLVVARRIASIFLQQSSSTHKVKRKNQSGSSNNTWNFFLRKSDSSGSEYRRKACCHTDGRKDRCRVSGVSWRKHINMLVLYACFFCTRSSLKYMSFYKCVCLQINITIHKVVLWSWILTLKGRYSLNLQINDHFCKDWIWIHAYHWINFFLALGVSFPHLFLREFMRRLANRNSPKAYLS